jgi:hypothetical protein
VNTCRPSTLGVSSVSKREIGRHERRRVLAEQARRADQHLLGAPQRPHDDIRVLRRLRAHAQRDVDRILEQVDHAIRHADVHLHLRIAVQEFREDARQHRLRQRDGHAHAHRPARRRAQLLHRVHRRLRFGQHGLTMLVEQLAGLGQRELARRTLQQPHAERGLEFRQPSRQARFGDTEHAFRGREAAMLDDLREVHEVVQVVCIDVHVIVPISEQSIAEHRKSDRKTPNIIAPCFKNNAIPISPRATA